MTKCIICGEEACGEETFTNKDNQTITCYFCSKHINQVAIPDSRKEEMRIEESLHEKRQDSFSATIV